MNRICDKCLIEEQRGSCSTFVEPGPRKEGPHFCDWWGFNRWSLMWTNPFNLKNFLKPQPFKEYITVKKKKVVHIELGTVYKICLLCLSAEGSYVFPGLLHSGGNNWFPAVWIQHRSDQCSWKGNVNVFSRNDNDVVGMSSNNSSDKYVFLSNFSPIMPQNGRKIGI